MSKVRPVVNFAGRRLAIDVPHIGFASVLAGWCAWYCWDAWHANSDIENMILIFPVSIAAILLYLFVVAGSCHRIDRADTETVTSHGPVGRSAAIKIVGSMALLAGFVLAGPSIGFDVATFGYILLMMAFLGERRIPVLLLVPLVFTVVVIYCFGTLLATPLPVLILRGQG